MPPFLAADAVAIVVVIVAVVIELRTGHIPNALTLPLVPIAFLMCTRDGRWAERGIALVVAITLVIVVFRTNAIGGGALKLIGGLIVVLGPSALALAVVVALRALIGSLRRKPDEVQVFALSPWVLIGTLFAAGADYLRFLR